MFTFVYIFADVTTGSHLGFLKTTAFQCIIAPFASCKPPYIYIQIALAHNIKI